MRQNQGCLQSGLLKGPFACQIWQGVCSKGVCVCNPGYRGAYCEVPPACSGILDAAGNCCPAGVLSQNGTCCGAVCPLALKFPTTLYNTN